jgi:hypothetical protein
MNGTSILNASTSFVANVPRTWTIVGTGDFNGDGRSDILWRDTSGNVAIWEMNGTTILNQATSFVEFLHRWAAVGARWWPAPHGTLPPCVPTTFNRMEHRRNCSLKPH